LVGVAGWSLSAALVWSFFDALTLADEIGVSYLDGWMAAVGAGVTVAGAMLPVGLVVGWWWHRSQSGHLVRRKVWRQPAKGGAIFIAVALGWLILSFSTYGLLALYRGMFASELVHNLALSMSVPLVAVVAAALAYRTTRPLASWLGRITSKIATLAVSSLVGLALVVGWSLGLIALGNEIWSSLAPTIYLPVVIVGICSVTGAVLADLKRVRWAMAVVGVLAVPVAAVGLFGTTSKELRLALEYRDTGAGFISKLTSPNQARGFAAAKMNRDRLSRGKSAVCGPTLESPTLGEVGHIGTGRVQADAPDIVWLTVDALRWDHTSLSGYERDTTPHIARHARQAAVFEQAYTPASSTRQTFRSLFTGVHPSMIEPPRGPIYALTIPDDQHTLAEFLTQAGYETYVYSSDAYIFSKEHGALQGFQFIDETPYELKEEQGYTAPVIIDRLIEELDSGGEPKFIWTHLIEPHAPFAGGPEPVDFGPAEIDRYDAAIHFTDSQIGRLLDFVAERQQRHPTYVVITADHGEAWKERGHRRHGYTVFQEEVHVPMIVWGPDIEPARYEQPVGVLDLYSTTFELAGLDVPRGSCAQSLAGALRAGHEPEARPILVEQVPDRSRTHFSVGFIRGRDKIMVQPKIDAISLYNLDKDPGERDDLADQAPERLEEHLDALRAYWRQRGMDPADYGVAEK
jgi:arylsulfatase A-like enzyme